MMLHYLLVEGTANSGRFQLTEHSAEAESASAAIEMLSPLAASGQRVAVWTYRRMIGLPPMPAPDAGEAGARYLVLAQVDGTSGDFVLGDDELDSDDVDAAHQAVARQVEQGHRIGLMPAPAASAPVAAATPASAPAPTPNFASSAAPTSTTAAPAD